MPAPADILSQLSGLGFSTLEAEAYLHLLGAGPRTGYQVAKAIGRPTANTYKAVESLANRGAVMIEEGQHRLCRPVPPKEFLRRASREFQQQVESLETVLSRIEPAGDDDRVYKLETPGQVLERAEALIAEAESVIVLDAFPRALEALRPALEKRLRRKQGVDVFLEAYAPFELQGARVVVVRDGGVALAQWQGEQLNLVVDSRRHVMALFEPELRGVRQAVWSNSLYLSCLHHAGRLCEHTLILAQQALQDGMPEVAGRALAEHRFFFRAPVRGQQELMDRFGPAVEEQA
ncbi:MAG: hypothetical protein JNK87_38935 [Bryobacterales bacterium]|nr:hypothetical protein [Bryobacterales bacterium]